MNIKINISTKQIELLDSVPFEEVKKFVDIMVAAYGWEPEEVSIAVRTEYLITPPVFIEPRPLHVWPYRTYEVWCGASSNAAMNLRSDTHARILD